MCRKETQNSPGENWIIIPESECESSVSDDPTIRKGVDGGGGGGGGGHFDFNIMSIAL